MNGLKMGLTGVPACVPVPVICVCMGMHVVCTCLSEGTGRSGVDEGWTLTGRQREEEKHLGGV